MKRAFALGVVLGILGCQVVEESNQSTAAAVSGEVENFLDSYRQAIEARDASALKKMYVEDDRFAWIEDGEVRYRSPEDILTGLAGLSSDVVIQTEYQDVEVSPVGNDGARAVMGFRTVIGEGPSAYRFGGIVSIVLEKSPSGWRIVSGHTSTPRPDPR